MIINFFWNMCSFKQGLGCGELETPAWVKDMSILERNRDLEVSPLPLFHPSHHSPKPPPLNCHQSEAGSAQVILFPSHPPFFSFSIIYWKPTVYQALWCIWRWLGLSLLPSNWYPFIKTPVTVMKATLNERHNVLGNKQEMSQNALDGGRMVSTPNMG